MADGNADGDAGTGELLFTWDWFFIPPLYTITIYHPRDVLVLVVFLAVTLLVGQLSSAARRRAEEALRRARSSEALYDLSLALIARRDLSEAHERAHAAIARRRAHGRDATLFLRREVYPVRGGIVLDVGWVPRRWPRRALVVKQVGDVAVVVDRRVGRYTQWRDLTISAWRLGPFEDLVVVDELRVLLEMQAWNRRIPPPAIHLRRERHARGDAVMPGVVSPAAVPARCRSHGDA